MGVKGGWLSCEEVAREMNREIEDFSELMQLGSGEGEGVVMDECEVGRGRLERSGGL